MLRIFLVGMICILGFCAVEAQGPPITSDKPIMLGAKRTVFKTLTEIRQTEQGTFTRIPLIVHYLPTSNMLVGIQLPLAIHRFDDGLMADDIALADIQLWYKYQFYRKDGMGKTLRMVAKTVQTLPTGKDYDIEGISMGEYQSYFAWVTGYESIRYGISNELGYAFMPSNNRNALRHKFGFGLPLLKPSYPVNQLNLFFEYEQNWFHQAKEYELLYAQGIQYAKGPFTYELAVQFPLIQQVALGQKRAFSILLGTRFVL